LKFFTELHRVHHHSRRHFSQFRIIKVATSCAVFISVCIFLNFTANGKSRWTMDCSRLASVWAYSRLKAVEEMTYSLSAEHKTENCYHI